MEILSRGTSDRDINPLWIERLGQSVEVLARTAADITSTAFTMSEGNSDQAQQVGQVSTAVEEMTATIVESSKNAAEASEGARGASETANNGGKIVGESIQVVAVAVEKIGRAQQR